MAKNTKQNDVYSATRGPQRSWLGVLDFGIPSRVKSAAVADRPGRSGGSGFVAMP